MWHRSIRTPFQRNRDGSGERGCPECGVSGQGRRWAEAWVIVALWGTTGLAGTGLAQVSSVALPLSAPPAELARPGLPGPPPSVGLEPSAKEPSGYAYAPGKRRDPFMPVLSARQMQASQDRAPLQRVPLGNLTLIGVVWGGFGSRAMVQTPDGKGYSVHHGTLIGPNNGVVTAISEDTITVEERVTDLYGRRLVREHVAVLGAGFGEVKDRSYRAGISRDQPSGADMASVDDLTRSARSVQFAALSNTMAAMDINSPPGAPGGYSYNPLGRRDPFAPVIRESGSSREADIALPPLQRVTLTELTLIGIIWGGFGYSAMVQTPDGKGYTVNRGTVIGPNNGVVTAISENGITVEERFTDLYGKKQVREHVIPLRLKEKAE